MTATSARVVVGISGATGALYGIRLIQHLRDLGCEAHVVISRAGRRTIAEETTVSLAEIRELATVMYPFQDVGAAIASGSFQTRGMVIAPCSIRSAAEIATGVTSSLLTRAADVTLKERRPLVLMIRESPLHIGHLRMLTNLAEMGAIIAPPLPAFYMHPKSFVEMIDHTLGRVLDLLDLPNSLAPRWPESGFSSEPGGRQPVHQEKLP